MSNQIVRRNTWLQRVLPIRLSAGKAAVACGIVQCFGTLKMKLLQMRAMFFISPCAKRPAPCRHRTSVQIRIFQSFQLFKPLSIIDYICSS